MDKRRIRRRLVATAAITTLALLAAGISAAQARDSGQAAPPQAVDGLVVQDLDHGATAQQLAQSGVVSENDLHPAGDGRRRVMDERQPAGSPQAGSSRLRPAGLRSTLTLRPPLDLLIVKSRMPSPTLMPSTRSRS